MPRLSEKQFKKVYVPNDPAQAWIEIVYLKKGLRDRMDSDCNTVTGTTDEKGEMVTSIAFNTTKKRKLFYKEVIHAWGGFLDKKGRETKPTTTNIARFEEEIDDFYNWLKEESETFIAEVEAEEEPAQENS